MPKMPTRKKEEKTKKKNGETKKCQNFNGAQTVNQIGATG